MNPPKPTPLEKPSLWSRFLASDTASVLRQLVLLIVAFGVVGLVPELLLLEHIKSPSQLIPFALLALTAIGVVWVYARPKPSSLRFFQGVMVLSALGGLMGLWEHLEGNLEYVRELNPSLSGLPLIWKAMHKGTPVLAPGTLIQMALLGLVFSFRHPAWASRKER